MARPAPATERTVAGTHAIVHVSCGMRVSFGSARG